MSLGPFFRSPFTDLTGGLITRQADKTCGPFEMRFMTCMEAYGYHRGLQKCADLMDDLNECIGNQKQLKRVEAMRDERLRQVLKGERELKDIFDKPPEADAF